MLWAGDVPVTPDGDQAREWLTRELAQPVYHQGDSTLLARFLKWLQSLLDSLTNAPGTSVVAVVLVAAIVVAVVVAILIAGPIARSRRASQTSAPVLDEDDARTAAEMRRDAQTAEKSGDLRRALVEYFRALARGLEERTILDERAGRTADEVAREAGAALPDLASALSSAAGRFDAAFYGARHVEAAQVGELKELEARVRATRPLRSPAEVGTQ